jgi:DNA-binding NarL/FixJ family response regulator
MQSDATRMWSIAEYRTRPLGGGRGSQPIERPRFVQGEVEEIARYKVIRIVLVDDQADFRKTARLILSLQADMEVVGEAGNGVEALEVVEQVQPDVVLMDVHMPILDGIAATQQLHAAYPDLPIVLFTNSDHDAYVSEGLRAGAVGYLRKTVRREVLVSTLRAAGQRRS